IRFAHLSYLFSLFQFFFLLTRPPPSSTLFPYTTLFRSRSVRSRTRRACTPTKQKLWAANWASLGPMEERKDGDSSGVWGLLRKRSEEHTSELQSHLNLVCRLLLEKKKKKKIKNTTQKKK